MDSALREAIRGQRDAMVELTRQLVAIPTENPPGNGYPETRQVILRHLEILGFKDTRVEGDCILSIAGSGDRTLYFSGHYDVVPAQSPAQFEPYIKGANLFGRGSSDMKSGLAAMIYAARALADSGIGPRIGLVFVPDEENAGPRGSRYLEQHGLLGQNAIGMLTPEPTGGIVWNANRGAITMKVTVKGKHAHVGRQTEGLNAFERMLAVTGPLLALKREVEDRTTAFQLAPEPMRRSILMLGGQCESGPSFNVVPESCSFTIDRRINPEEDFDHEKGRLLQAIHQSGIDLDVEIIQEGKSASSPDDGPLAVALAQSVEEVTGHAPRFEMCPGLLETRFYAARGIPAFAYGPGLLTVSHGPNEFVPLDRITQSAEIYALTAVNLLHAMPAGNV